MSLVTLQIHADNAGNSNFIRRNHIWLLYMIPKADFESHTISGTFFSQFQNNFELISKKLPEIKFFFFVERKWMLTIISNLMRNCRVH